MWESLFVGWEVKVSLLLGVLLLLTYLKVRSVYRYFEERGVKYVKPTFLLGSYPKTLLGTESIGKCFSVMYEKLKGEKIGGCFVGIAHHWVVRDPDYIMKIFVTNFEHFPDRGFLVDEKTNPLEAHLFLLNGNKWKYLRNKLSPIFTSGKLKYMYEQMYKSSEVLIECFDKLADGKDVDLKETFGRFATDVIGQTAFGIESDSLRNPDSKFRQMGLKVFEINIKNVCLFAFRFAFPKLILALKMRTTDKTVSDYFRRVIQDVLRHRRETGTVRNDFIQLALQLQEKGTVDLDPNGKIQQSNGHSEDKVMDNFIFTDDLLAAQSYVFFLAGFETTSTTFYFAMYMLAQHPDIQEELRTEVRAVKEKQGSFTYESLKDLNYLECFLNETLRLFPAVPWLIRECIKSFTFPDGVTISKGDKVVIPVMAIHMDDKYYPEPEKFKPQRFESPPIKGTYLPFGDGPRICIGKRFAMVELKMTLAKLLDRYSFEKSPLNRETIEFSPSITLMSKYPLMLRVKKL